MEFRILGSVEVLEDGRELDLGSPKQRMLLALLLLHRNEPVPSEVLAEWLWSGRPPRTAVKALQVYVSGLRRTLGGRLETRGSSYLLRVDEGELDLEQVERLAEEAVGTDPTRAAQMLRRAQERFRGDPLPELRYSEAARADITRLEELRLHLIEQRVDAELRFGGGAQLLPEIEVEIAAHPLRERLRSQQMLVLYRAGRHAEALEAYESFRRLLDEERGLEPSRDLKALQRSILAQDVSLEAPTERTPGGTRRGEMTSRMPFVGRQSELREAEDWLDAAARGRGQLVLVSGEPGIGKSRLCEAIAAVARERDVRVFVGRAWEAGGAPAFWPWTEALRSYFASVDGEILRRNVGPGAADLARLLPELRERIPDLPLASPEGSEVARFRLFEAVAQLLTRASTNQPLMIVLDDLHAADVPSLLLLRYLSRRLSSTATVVVAAYRDVDPVPTDPTATIIAEVAREPTTRRLPLHGLSEAEVASFIELAAGTFATPELSATLHDKTDGNPLFLNETVRLLAAEGREAAATVIPASIRDVISRRLARLPAPCRDALDVASVLGREFDVDVLGRMSDSNVLDALDDAVSARVVGVVPGNLRRFCFSHVLVRDTLYEQLAPGTRLRLHLAAAEAIESVYGDEPGPELPALALHAIAGGDRERGVRYARLAGDRALKTFAFEEAVRLYEQGLSAAGSETDRADLLLAIGEAHARAGATDSAKSAYRTAAQLADACGSPELLARAALGYGGRMIWDASRDDAYLRPLLEKALAAAGGGDSITRARLLARLAGGPLRDSRVDPARRRAMGEQALETARRIGDPATLAYALVTYVNSHQGPDFTVKQAVLARELIEVALSVQDFERAMEGYALLFEASFELADVATARASLDAMTAVAEELRQPAQRWVAAVYGTLIALLEGRLRDAEHSIATTRDLGEHALTWPSTASYVLQLYLLRREQGRAAEAEAQVRAAADASPSYPILRCALADLLAERGSCEEARAELDTLAYDDFTRIPFDEEWTVSLCLLASVVTALADRPRASALYELLLPYADRITLAYTEISLGPVSRYLALLAAAMEDFDAAEQHHRRAIELSAQMAARPSLAHTKLAYTATLLDRKRPGDSTHAAELVEQAIDIYRELGMKAYSRRARQLARLVSVCRPG